jgi:hypothetical protein
MTHTFFSLRCACVITCITAVTFGFQTFAADAQKPWAARTDRAAVLAELRDVSLTGMSRRLGPDYAAYHGDAAAEKFPEIWMAPSKQDPGGRRYQIGGPWTKAGGDFSSTQGQVLFVPDAGNFPVDRVTILEWSNGTFSERPEPPWHGGFRPEPTAKKWREFAINGDPGVPIGMARGYGSWANCGVIAFSSGLVSVAGTVTAHGTDPFFQFPANKLPTAVSVTNKNEFALITVCDTQTHRGEVAIFALEVNGKKTQFVHEWQDDVWSLPSVAMFTGIKLLGYVDLPGIEFPTGVCAVGNHQGGRMNGRDGNAGLLREYDLKNQADRNVFLKGSNAGYSSTAGFAVVCSKYDGKAAFIDLQPLFARVREMYFTSEEHFQKTRDSGLDPKQWPQSFDVDPSWRPGVVATIDVPQATAVLASLSGGDKARAFIASLDGRVGVYSVGGLATDGPASPKDIVRIGEVTVGHNPTCLTYQKNSRDTILACSRGDREIAWIKTAANQPPQVIRRLRDARLLDPVNIEVADTHGVETSIVTVCDFKGRQVVNYRYSRVVFATQGGAKFGMGPDGTAEFECGGTLEIPGAPICVSATNVN